MVVFDARFMALMCPLSILFAWRIEANFCYWTIYKHFGWHDFALVTLAGLWISTAVLGLWLLSRMLKFANP